MDHWNFPGGHGVIVAQKRRATNPPPCLNPLGLHTLQQLRVTAVDAEYRILMLGHIVKFCLLIAGKLGEHCLV